MDNALFWAPVLNITGDGVKPGQVAISNDASKQDNCSICSKFIKTIENNVNIELQTSKGSSLHELCLAIGPLVSPLDLKNSQ